MFILYIKNLDTFEQIKYGKKSINYVCSPIRLLYKIYY